LFITDTGGGQVWRVANGVVVMVAVPTSLALSASSNPMVTGQSVTLTANVVATIAGAGVPAGNVAFTDTFRGSPKVIAKAHANQGGVPVTLGGAGTHLITAPFTDPSGQFATAVGTLSETVLVPASITSIAPVVPAIRDTPVTSIDVTFTRPINPAKL